MQNPLEQDLIGSIGQTDSVVFKISDSKASPRIIVQAIKKYFEADGDVKEVKIFKGKREISIERNYFRRDKKDYIKTFLAIWQ